MSSDANDPQAELIQAVTPQAIACPRKSHTAQSPLASPPGKLANCFDRHPAARGLNAELGEDRLLQETLLRAASLTFTAFAVFQPLLFTALVGCFLRNFSSLA
jgi:hypothetical protein